ncbi:MAG: 3-deoxy-manno-octulosonate cytidylyltransferase [Synergistaceae bacterium]|nr:3-deoxy-manno-octulosonate cytidylyltransferase [Synergistaceae bacterium]
MIDNNLKFLGVIPARFSSSRFPGKPLADINGKPMIQHVYERAKLSSSLCDVIVATDDERILKAVNNFGGKVVMTNSNHPNGTSRVCEAAKLYCGNNINNINAVINIQGDEPLLNPVMIDEVAELLRDDAVNFATLCREFKDFSEANNANAVKVVFDKNFNALYFSRSIIPYRREKTDLKIFHHIGIYGYKLEFLKLYITLPMTPLAETESLEQLKVLESGYKIRVKVTSCQDESLGVDTPEDLERVRRIIAC